MIPTACTPQALNFDLEAAAPSAWAKVLKEFFKKIHTQLSSFVVRHDLNLEQWRQLEYRNEMAGRMGEKMNPVYLR